MDDTNERRGDRPLPPAMRKRGPFGALIGLMALALAGCEVSSLTQPDEAQDILFHISYENHAWGYQASSWYIDRLGRVWSTDPPLLWHAETAALLDGQDPSISYPESTLEAEYLAARDSFVLSLPREDVDDMARLISAAASGSYSEPENTMADAGAYVIGALVYDRDSRRYRKVVLSMRGDWTVVNEATAAGELDAWLEAVRHQFSF